MLERALIDHGSPTLANMKVGSLFTSSCADVTGFRAEFQRVQAALESVCGEVLHLYGEGARAGVRLPARDARGAACTGGCSGVSAGNGLRGYIPRRRTGIPAAALGGIALLPARNRRFPRLSPQRRHRVYARRRARLPMQRMLEGVHERVRSDAHFPALQGVPRGIPDAFPRRMAA